MNTTTIAQLAERRVTRAKAAQIHRDLMSQLDPYRKNLSTILNAYITPRIAIFADDGSGKLEFVFQEARYLEEIQKAIDAYQEIEQCFIDASGIKNIIIVD